MQIVNEPFYLFQDSKSRFVSVGENKSDNDKLSKFVILQRTRREHYNLVYAQTDVITGKARNKALFKIYYLSNAPCKDYSSLRSSLRR